MGLNEAEKCCASSCEAREDLVRAFVMVGGELVSYVICPWHFASWRAGEVSPATLNAIQRQPNLRLV